ncbi:radical SAM protein [bacterium]|nr:radical SAM protein [bacterium]
MSYAQLARGLVRTKLHQAPFSANFKITERCNLRCPTCGIWRRASKSRELTLAELSQVMPRLRQLGLSRLVLTGGEPTVRKDIVEIVGLAVDQGLSTTVLTNGLLLKDDLVKDLFEAGLDHIGISLDFLTPDKQDHFYSLPGAWHRIDTTLKRALKYNKRGIVYIMTTLMPENITEILDLFCHAEALGAHFVINPVMGSAPHEPNRVFSGHTEQPNFSNEQLDAIEQVYRVLIEYKKAGRPIMISELFLRNTLTWLRTHDLRWHCHAGRYYFNIFSDGGVAVCNEYPSLLSVRDPEFVNQFRSEHFQAQAARIRAACSGCNFSCWRELSTLLTDWRSLGKQAISYGRQLFLSPPKRVFRS